jgi:Ca2+-binding EF-hand superfamily protein
MKKKVEEDKKKEWDTSKVIEKSDKMVNQIQHLRIKELFNALDSDCDGKISSDKIDLS